MNEKWIINNSPNINKPIFLSVDLDFFNYSKYDKYGKSNWKKVYENAQFYSIPTFITSYHDEFIDVANLNWKKIFNYDSHDDFADLYDECNEGSWLDIFEDLSKNNQLTTVRRLMEGCWLGIVKNRQEKELYWKYAHDNWEDGRCCYSKNMWRSSESKYSVKSKKKVKHFDFVEWENVGCIGFCISPDFTDTEIMYEFIEFFGIDQNTLTR